MHVVKEKCVRKLIPDCYLSFDEILFDFVILALYD
jgi:hypothetical protein